MQRDRSDLLPADFASLDICVVYPGDEREFVGELIEEHDDGWSTVARPVRRPGMAPAFVRRRVPSDCVMVIR